MLRLNFCKADLCQISKRFEVSFLKDICGKAFIFKGDEEIFDLLYNI